MNIAIIKQNNILFDDLEKYVLPLLYIKHSKDTRTQIKQEIYNYIWSIIEQYISFINIENEEDFYEIMCSEVQENFADHDPSECTYYTEGSYSTPKRFYELVYWKPSWKDYQNSTCNTSIINNIGCLFSLSHSVIENSCVIIANEYDLSATKYVKQTSITKNNIIKIICRRYFHSAVLIGETSLVKYYYQNLQYLVSIIFNTEDKIDTIPFSHLKYNLVYYFKQYATKYINQIATRINGEHRIYGDVLVIHEMDDDIYTNITIHEMKRLNVLSYGSSKDRELNETEMFTIPDYQIDGEHKVPFWSRYIVSNNRMTIWQQNKNKCIGCDNKCIDLCCNKCYRVNYCSMACQEADYENHKEECIS